MRDRSFSNYEYSAFISYAGADDEFWNRFVSCFTLELNRKLPLRPKRSGITVPKAYISSDTPMVAGCLSDQLRDAINSSFSMFLFVHECYLESDWCLKELEHFKTLFGDNGFRERLYVIAMSKPAIEKLTQRPSWKVLCPFNDQIWLEFFQEDDPDMPLRIYADLTRCQEPLVEPFCKTFMRVLMDLEKKIAAAVAKEPRPVPYPTALSSPGHVAGDDQFARVYIEGSKEQEQCWESLGRQFAARWDNISEPHPPFRPIALPMTEIDRRPMLDDADGVVLLWGRKTPDSLAAQIRKVEPKLAGPNFAPGLIMYLGDGENDLPDSISVNNWKVVRCEVGSDGSTDVLPSDEALLSQFLATVNERKSQRLAHASV